MVFPNIFAETLFLENVFERFAKKSDEITAETFRDICSDIFAETYSTTIITGTIIDSKLLPIAAIIDLFSML